MVDPESIAALQSFAYGIAQNLIASAIVEWKKLKDDNQALENAAFLEEHQKAKNLETRISEKVILGLQQLQLKSAEFAVLLPLASDPVLSTTLAQQVVSDTYSAASVAKLLIEAEPALAAHSGAVQKIAALLVQTIQSAIADDPHLHRVKDLQFQARVTEDIANFRGVMAVDAAKTQTALNQLSREVERLTTAMKPASAECLPGAEHLRSMNERRFGRAREELLTGSIVVAERLYRELVADLDSQVGVSDRTLLFRCYTNLGSSLWQQFRRDEAVLWFDKAYQTKPDESKAKTNKALCHIHRREFSAAIAVLDEAKQTAPDSFELVYLVSAVHLEQGDFRRAVETLEAQAFDSSDYFVALAQAFLRLEDFSKAVEAARKALAIDAKSTDALTALANGLGFPLVQRRGRGEVGGHSLTEKERQEAKEAVQACETVAKTLRSQDRNHQLSEILTNLSAFYELVNEDEKAAQTAAQAVELLPDQPTALVNLWASQMRSGKYADAFVTATRLVQCGAQASGRLRQIESLLLDSKIDRVIEECADPGELRNEPRFFEIKARAFFEAHDIDKAFATIEDGIKSFPDNGVLLAVKACFHNELGDPNAAERDMNLAERAGGGNRARVLAEAAAFFCEHGRWSDAAKRLLELGAESEHSPFFARYLICLFNLGQYPNCRSLAEHAIRSKPDFDETLHELAARCAYNSNDLRSAEDYLDELVRHGSPNIVEQQKMLAQVCLRLDEPDRAFAILKKAHTRKPKDLDLLTCLSFVSSLRKQPREAIDYAMAAVEAAPRDTRSHMAVMRASLGCPPDFKPDKRSAKAFQRSLQFLQKDPAGYVKAIPVEKDLKTIIGMVKERADLAQKVTGLLRKKNLPMAFLSTQLAGSPFQTWLGLIGDSSLHVHMAHGTGEEQAREVEAAASAKIISLDVFALLTLRLLKRLDLLHQCFAKILVHTAILEAVIEDIRELETGRKGCSITYHDGQLLRTEANSDQIAAILAMLRDIRDFLKSPAVQLVGLDPSVVPNRETRQARELLGAIFFDPMLVAQEHGAAYYADDAPMRSLASNPYKLPGFCTQGFLRAAKEKKLLTVSEYEDCVITLLRHNYHFVSESAETLARLAETDGFRVNDLTKGMLHRVVDPKIDQNTSVRVLSDFSLFLWRADYSKAGDTRDTWLGLCADALLEAKLHDRLFAEFILNLGMRSLTHPEAFAGVSSWLLRSKKMSKDQHNLILVIVQQVILQMVRLAKQEYPWWPSLAYAWNQHGRLNATLHNSGRI